MTNELKLLYVIGAGGFGREVIWLAETINTEKKVWNIKGFLDDDQTVWNSEIDGYPVVGGIGYLDKADFEIWCVVAIGNPGVRRKIITKFEQKANVHFATLIAPDCKIGIGSTVDEGSIVCSGNIITVDAHIGKHTIVNLGCTIGHDVCIGDYSTLYPGVHVSGCVKIGDLTEIGTGAQIIQGLSINPKTIIGAGATVVKDIVESGTYVGVPAKKISK